MQEKCSDCGTASPETDTSYTLIDSAWRLTREQTKSGTYEAVWRCPLCWSAFKRRAEAAMGSGERPVAMTAKPARPKAG